MEMHDLVTVYTVTNPIEAEIIKNALEDEGIHCVLDGLAPAVAVGLSLMTIQVKVAAEDAEKAQAFLAEHEEHHQEEEETESEEAGPEA